MSRGPRRPDRTWFAIALVAIGLVALGAGFAFYVYNVRARSIASLSESAREELAALPVPARATAEIEQTWVADGFKAELLVAPVGPLPCTTDGHPPSSDPDVRIEQIAADFDRNSANLLVAQVLGTELIEAGRHAEAERVLTQALDSTTLDEEIIRAARVSSTLDLDDVDVSNVIHVHHALGVARLAQSSSEPPWISLKNVIGSVKPLSNRRLMGSTRGQPTWSRLLIAAPGCPVGGGGKPPLSTYDLYNNLVVAYMRGKFTGDNATRSREFARPNKTYPSALHKLLTAQVAAARANGWQNEAQLWALSNVEQLIDWRMPDDARLAVNAVQVIDWWTARERCPATICTEDLLAGIRTIRDELIEQAFKRRNIASEQRTPFARTGIGLLAKSTLERARVADAARSMREWLPANERRTLDDLLAADAARAELPRRIFTPSLPQAGGTPALHDRWRRAALTDLAAAAARWAGGRPAAEQRHALIVIRQFLGNAGAPPELLALESQRPLLDRLRLRLAASKFFWGLLASIVAALVWLVLLWILVNVREWWLLRVSLYNVEVDHLATIEERP